MVEKGVDTVDTHGGPQEMAIISESGLYSLILTSRKPAAKRGWPRGGELPWEGMRVLFSVEADRACRKSLKSHEQAGFIAAVMWQSHFVMRQPATAVATGCDSGKQEFEAAGGGSEGRYG